MDKSKFGSNQEAHLDPAYHNGQSDAEKLMHDHLQSGEPLTDKDLNNIEITKTSTTTENTVGTKPDKDDDSDTETDTGSDRMITPLDVLGS